MQWLTIGVFAAVLLALSFLPNEKKRPFPWRLFVPAAGAAAVYLACFSAPGLWRAGALSLHVDDPGQRPVP